MATGTASSCFHCGQPLPATASWTVRIGQQTHALCCAGCHAVAQALVDHGLTDYYRTREGFAARGEQPSLVPPELKLYDTPDAIERFSDRVEDAQDLREATLSVEGIRCAACVWLIERRLQRMPGVTGAELNVATERLRVRWNAVQCKLSTMLAALRQLGYVAYPFDPLRQGEHARRNARRLFRQLFVAGLSMMQVMMYAFPAYISSDGTMGADMRDLMRWASLLLTIPAVAYSAQPFLRGAWIGIRHRAPGMDVPVALGILAGFAGSVAATLRGSGDVYFDSVTMFIFLLLCSRYLEQLARRKAASALEKLQHAMPLSATRVTGYPAARQMETVAAASLLQHDVVLVKPGEPVPADCMLLEGDTEIDASLLSGESRALRKRAGDELPGGAINVAQPVIARVMRPVTESTLSSLLKLVERAGQAKPRLALWAGRVSAWFVTALLLLAVAVFLFWHLRDPGRAWEIAVAVLVVSCPCALSLATPSALAAAIDRLVRQGVLVAQPHVLETLHRCTHVVFDKTGTLTIGRIGVSGIECADAELRGRWLRIAAALEAGSAHPVAVAIRRAADEDGQGLIATQVRHVAGQGVEGMVDGVRYRLGNAGFVAAIAGIGTNAAADDAAVYLGADTQWLARIALSDRVRDDAAQVVRHFQSIGKTVMLLSGDRDAVVREVARQTGILHAYGDRLPEQKLAFVQQLQAQGAIVAMIGDGINDAAVLRAADVSFAMGAGATLAQVHADAVLLSDRLSLLIDASRTAAATMRVIRQNLAWACVYNALAIPAAACGWLGPLWSGVGMAASSAVVVLNALRLRRMARADDALPMPEMSASHIKTTQAA